jgi:hypothetical protein
MDDPEKFPFNEFNIEDAPAASGIYVLYDGRDEIYVGKAEGDDVTIRSCLESHLRGEKGECTKAANYFRYQVVATDDLDTRIKSMLDGFEMVHKRLPRCQ